MNEENNAGQVGPLKVCYMTCRGCKFLRTKQWKDYLENDETDYGTYADCTALDRSITAYWNENDPPPVWCPYLEKSESEVKL